jgi:hypothetical protein
MSGIGMFSSESEFSFDDFILLLKSSFIFSFFENVEFKKIPTPCDYVCEGGGCLFTNCENRAYCPGGACDFISSVSPSCSGGFLFF